MGRSGIIAAFLVLLLPLEFLWASDNTFEGINLSPGLSLEHANLYQTFNSPSSAPTSPSEVLKNLSAVSSVDRLQGGRYWLHVKLSSSSETERWVFDISNSIIDNLQVYIYGRDEPQEVASGYYNSHVYSLHYGVDFELAMGDSSEFLIYIDSRYFSAEPKFQILPQAEYSHNVAIENSLIIACLGAVLILALYNLFIGAWMRDKSYSYYSVYLILTVIAWSAAFNALGEWFGMYSYWWLIPPFYLTISFNILYFIHFLGLPKHYPKLSNLSYAVAVWAGLMALAMPLFSPGYYVLIQAMTSSVWIVLGLTCGVVCLKSGYKPARFFVVAFALLMLGMIASILPVLGVHSVVENNYIATLIAQTVDILLLSLALADRINHLRKEKELALGKLITFEKVKGQVEKEAKQALADANEKLQDALDLSEMESERKSNFLRMVSHELRTPLYSISSSVEQLKSSISDKEKTDIFGDITYGTSRLCNQVDNLVLMAETDDDKLKPESYSFELRAVMDKIHLSALERIDSNLVVFDYRLPDDMPEYFIGDAYLIGHLIRTVLDNACRYCEKGSIVFSLDWTEESQMLLVTVKDDGCGMSKEQQKVVFDGFIQASCGLTRKSEGLGLGLTLCCRLSNILDAQLSIVSSLGRGTEINFQIPLQPQHDVRLPVQQKDYKGPILLVEDNLVNAKVLERMVAKMGYPVDVEYSGLGALSAIDNRCYSIILMDVQMPDMDGITTTQKIRARGIDTPIIAVTANSDTEVRRDCRRAGMNDFLVKPVHAKDLINALQEWQPHPVEQSAPERQEVLESDC